MRPITLNGMSVRSTKLPAPPPSGGRLPSIGVSSITVTPSGAGRLFLPRSSRSSSCARHSVQALLPKPKPQTACW